MKLLHLHNLAVLFGLAVLTLGSVPRLAAAVDYSWTQTDWSGGVGTNTSNQYSAATTIDTTTAGQATLSLRSPWYNTNWLYRKQLTLTNAQTEALSNFPVLVSLTSSNFDFSKAQSSGQDIRFTDADGTTVLSYEIEQWNAASSTASIWVNIPQVDTGSSDSIYLYYGNSSASDGQAANATWNSSYQAIYHFSDTLSSTAVNDSASNNHDGTSQGGMTTSNQITGKVGGSFDFDGTNDYVNVVDAAGLDITDDLTLEGWLKADSAGTVPGTITNALLDTLEFDIADGHEPSIVQVSGDLYAIAYEGSGSDGFITTVTIDASGNISNSVVDTLEFDTANGQEPVISRVANGVYAVTYSGVSDDGFITTMTVDSTGLIGNSTVSSYEYDTANGLAPSLLHITGDVYALAYSGVNDDGFLVTVEMVSGHGVLKGAAYGIDYDASTITGNTNTQFITGTPASGWNHVVLTYDKDLASAQQALYINGSLARSQTYTTSMAANTNALQLGQYFDGQIDELRLSTTVRSAAWIGAAYTNMDGSSFVTAGSEEQRYEASGTLTSAIFDTGLTSVNWGTLTYTTSLSSSVTVKVRTGDSATLSDATAFVSCTVVSSGTDLSGTSCVGDSKRYIQYQVTLTPSTGQTPNWQDVTINYSQPAIPVATSQTVNLNEDVTTAISLLGSDADVGDTLTFALGTSPSHGTIQNFSSSAGTLQFQPTADYFGSDSFTFTVSDGSNTSIASTVTLNITAVDDLPTAQAASQTTTEDTVVTFTLSASDVESDILTYALASAPVHGAASLLNATTGQVQYTPTTDYNGTDQFTFTASDASGTSPAATITLTMTAVNDTPTAFAQAVTVTEDNDKAVTLIGSDVESNSLTYSIVTQPVHGTVTGLNTSTGSLTYQPTSNYSGSDSFTYSVSDGVLTSVAATIAITVTNVNDGPVADAGTAIIATEDSVSIQLNGTASTDPENDTLTYNWAETTDSGDGCSLEQTTVSQPSVQISNRDSSYSCIFALVVTDGQTLSATDSAIINISADNDVPVLTAATTTLTIAEADAAVIEVAAADVDSASITLSAVDTASSFSDHGIAVTDYWEQTSGTAGQFSWSPGFDDADSYQFTVQATDGQNQVEQTIQLTVTNTNQAPTISVPIPNVSMSAGTTVTAFDLSNYVIDPDADAISYSVMATDQLVVRIVGTKVEITAPAGYDGFESISLYATDSNGLSTAITFVVTVTADTSSADYDHATGATSGPGYITIYDDEGNVIARWESFDEGGVIPKISTSGSTYIVYAIKSTPGSTLHAYTIQGELLKKKRLSPKLHWRNLAIGELAANTAGDEIVVTTRRQRQVYIKVWQFKLRTRQFKLLKKHQYAPLPKTNYRVAVRNQQVVLKRTDGSVITRWNPKL